MLLYRLGKCRITLKRGAMTWCSLAVAATLVMPHIGGEIHQWLNGLYCAVVILFVYPAIVAAGAGSPLTGKKTIAICQFLEVYDLPIRAWLSEKFIYHKK